MLPFHILRTPEEVAIVCGDVRLSKIKSKSRRDKVGDLLKVQLIFAVRHLMIKGTNTFLVNDLDEDLKELFVSVVHKINDVTSSEAIVIEVVLCQYLYDSFPNNEREHYPDFIHFLYRSLEGVTDWDNDLNNFLISHASTFIDCGARSLDRQFRGFYLDNIDFQSHIKGVKLDRPMFSRHNISVYQTSKTPNYEASFSQI